MKWLIDTKGGDRWHIDRAYQYEVSLRPFDAVEPTRDDIGFEALDSDMFDSLVSDELLSDDNDAGRWEGYFRGRGPIVATGLTARSYEIAAKSLDR